MNLEKKKDPHIIIYNNIIKNISKYENKQDFENEIKSALKYIENNTYKPLTKKIFSEINDSYIKNLIKYNDIDKSQANIFELICVLEYEIGGTIYESFSSTLIEIFTNICIEKNMNNKKSSNLINDFALLILNFLRTEFVACDNNKIKYFDNNIWKDDNSSILYNKVRLILPQIFFHKLDEDDKKNNLINQCIDILEDHNIFEKIKNSLIPNLQIVDIEKKLNKKINLIAFKNKVFDTNTKKFRNGMPHDFLSIGSQLYVPDREKITSEIFNECNQFLKMLFPSYELREYMLSWCASLLKPGNTEKLFHIWLGDGNNGKSAFANLLKKVFGDLCFSMPSSTFMRNKPNADSPTPHLLNIDTALLGIAQEPDGGVLNTSLMKELTGGDSLYIRRLYKTGENIEIKSQFVIQTNKEFFVDDTDPAAWDRVRVISFESHFIDENKINDFIKDDNSLRRDYNVFPRDKNIKLLYEKIAPAFVYILKERLNKYDTDGGLCYTENILEKTQQYKIDMDTFQTFLNDAIINFNEKEKDDYKIIIANETYYGTPIYNIYTYYNNFIKKYYSGRKSLNYKRLKTVLVKKYGVKSIISDNKEDYLIDYFIKDKYKINEIDLLSILK